MPKPDGGPAFPSHGSMGEVAQEGMTLRDYFAAKAMQAIVESAPWEQRIDETATADVSYRIADAMLAEREK